MKIKYKTSRSFHFVINTTWNAGFYWWSNYSNSSVLIQLSLTLRIASSLRIGNCEIPRMYGFECGPSSKNLIDKGHRRATRGQKKTSWEIASGEKPWERGCDFREISAVSNFVAENDTSFGWRFQNRKSLQFSTPCNFGICRETVTAVIVLRLGQGGGELWGYDIVSGGRSIVVSKPWYRTLKELLTDPPE